MVLGQNDLSVQLTKWREDFDVERLSKSTESLVSRIRILALKVEMN